MLRRAATWLTLAATAATSGCGYTSTYKPPQDGRARAVWDDDQLVVMAPRGLPRCEPPPPGAPSLPPRPAGPPGGAGSRVRVWVPIPLYVRVGPVLRPPRPPRPPMLSGLLGLEGLRGEGSEYVFVVLAVGAIVAFPFVAIGLATGHPEPEDEVAEAIDRVNQFNDQARGIIEGCERAYAPAAEAAR